MKSKNSGRRGRPIGATERREDLSEDTKRVKQWQSVALEQKDERQHVEHAAVKQLGVKNWSYTAYAESPCLFHLCWTVELPSQHCGQENCSTEGPLCISLSGSGLSSKTRPLLKTGLQQDWYGNSEQSRPWDIMLPSGTLNTQNVSLVCLITLRAGGQW